MNELEIVRTVGDLRTRVAAWRETGESVGLVPTMGALHAGHMSLVAAAREACDRVVATLFVNPKQFGPKEDFAVYPRDELKDSAKLSAAGVDLLFAPGIEAMYPPGHSTSVSVGPIGEVLEGAHRPGFFTGVATVVAKLLVQAQADRAFFGEKDFQQLQVIRRLVRDLDIPTQVVGVPTVREDDGLALSSRNAYLSAAERTAAPALYRALSAIAERVGAGEPAEAACARAVAELGDSGFSQVDYVTVCDAADLAIVNSLEELQGHPGRVLGAAWLGKTRLIDNIGL